MLIINEICSLTKSGLNLKNKYNMPNHCQAERKMNTFLSVWQWLGLLYLFFKFKPEFVNEQISLIIRITQWKNKSSNKPKCLTKVLRELLIDFVKFLQCGPMQTTSLSQYVYYAFVISQLIFYCTLVICLLFRCSNCTRKINKMCM